MKTVYSCPLGSKCTTMVDDDTIEKCAWLVEIAGKNPQTDEEIKEEKCALAWMPILAIENSKQQRATSHAVESARNEQVKGHNEFMSVISYFRIYYLITHI